MKKIMAFIVVLLSFTACNGNSPPSNAILAGAIAPSLVDNIQGGQTDLTGIWTFGCRQSASDELEMHIYTGTQFIALQLGYATSDGSCGGGFTELGKFTADYTIGTSAVATGGWKNGAPAPTAQDGVTTLPAFPTLAHLIISNPVGSGIFANQNPSPDLYWAIDASVPNTPVYFYVTTNGSGNLTSGLPEGAPGAPGGSYFVKQNITTTPVIILLGNNPTTLTVGGTYTDAGAMAFDDVDGDITANIVATGTVNTAVVGSYLITYNVSDAAGNAAATVVRTVNVVSGAPVITLLGANPETLAFGATYVDAGATALDDVDGDITANIVVTSTVNTAVVGSYSITYNVSDAAGNAATPVVRTVNVVDATAPVITLLGINPESLAVGGTYVDAGATALDDVDGDVTANIVATGTVNTAVVGSYSITYNVSDAAGNAATPVVRTVNVVDTTAPVITLLGINPEMLTFGATYVDAGATALDDVDGDITANIVVTGTVNTAVVGSYSITYNVSDAAGNAAATVVRTVNVNAPIGKLNDTGITACANATTNGLACPQVGFAGQDAEFGRDAQAVVGTLVKTGGGSAGFDFTKLDAAGQPLTNQAALYVNTPWSCVQDNVTGLMWEVKTGAGLGGLQDANHIYTWFNSDPNTNGGNAGIANGGTCVDTANCDTEKYVAAVNAVGLCGFSDWRLPNIEVLRSIVDYSIALPGPTIDTAYFPNTVSNGYWSSLPYAAFNSPSGLLVSFKYGYDFRLGKNQPFFIRLVRGGL